ncbi:hypothetical protein SDC9_98810 [bioreactor metagenome]|uniref:Uncharacterized protein n=1 Tax=bioreactor metagenome TaxID=1076179 RepID=A0A645AGB5_9ZZZZ
MFKIEEELRFSLASENNMSGENGDSSPCSVIGNLKSITSTAEAGTVGFVLLESDAIELIIPIIRKPPMRIASNEPMNEPAMILRKFFITH